jgi:hypothetical protein
MTLYDVNRPISLLERRHFAGSHIIIGLISKAEVFHSIYVAVGKLIPSKRGVEMLGKR